MQPIPEPAPEDPSRPRYRSLTWLDRIAGGNRWAKALLAFPAASAIFTIGTMSYLAGFFDPTYCSDLSKGETRPVSRRATPPSSC